MRDPTGEEKTENSFSRNIRSIISDTEKVFSSHSLSHTLSHPIRDAMSDDDWLREAMTNDALVSSVLVMLKHAEPPQISAPALPLDWSVRQRRSRQFPRKNSKPASRSPTTPLSFSGATSGSGCAGDGLEELSLPFRPSDTARSKVASITNEGSRIKKPRKKKKLAELKEEESLLLKERKTLENELATLSLAVEKQRTKNHNLKSMKLSSVSRSQKRVAEGTIQGGESPREMISKESQEQAIFDPATALLQMWVASDAHRPSSSHKSLPLLPDLNLMPEDMLDLDVLCS